MTILDAPWKWAHNNSHAEGRVAVLRGTDINDVIYMWIVRQGADRVPQAGSRPLTRRSGELDRPFFHTCSTAKHG